METDLDLNVWVKLHAYERTIHCSSIVSTGLPSLQAVNKDVPVALGDLQIAHASFKVIGEARCRVVVHCDAFVAKRLRVKVWNAVARVFFLRRGYVQDSLHTKGHQQAFVLGSLAVSHKKPRENFRDIGVVFAHDQSQSCAGL